MEYIDAKEMDQEGGDDARNKLKFDFFTLKIVFGSHALCLIIISPFKIYPVTHSVSL
jgi:hypothetical protein